MQAAKSEAVPGDIAHYREIFPRCKFLFAQSLGLLVLLAVLKLPPARDLFLERVACVKIHSSSEPMATRQVYDIFASICNDLGSAHPDFLSWRDRMRKATSEVGGPLKQHGFMAQMYHFGILRKANLGETTNILKLGFAQSGTQKSYVLLPFSDAIDYAIRNMLQLHETIHVLMMLSAPVTLRQYNQYSAVLENSFSRHNVDGMRTVGSYCASWAARTVLDGFMNSDGIIRLIVSAVDPISAFPGPDEHKHIDSAVQLFGAVSALSLCSLIGYKGSAHLLSMRLCLHLSMGKEVLSKIKTSRVHSQQMSVASRHQKCGVVCKCGISGCEGKLYWATEKQAHDGQQRKCNTCGTRQRKNRLEEVVSIDKSSCGSCSSRGEDRGNQAFTHIDGMKSSCLA